MASLTLRMALFLVFAALLVIQCSSDSSDCSSDTSDESSNGWRPWGPRRGGNGGGPRRGGWGPRRGGNGWGPADFPLVNNTGVAPAPFVPTPSNSSLPTILEQLLNPGLGRKKRSPHGHSNGWGPRGSRRGGNGCGPRRGGPPPANITSGGPLPADLPKFNGTLSPEEFFMLIGRKKRSPSSESSSDTSGESSNDVPPEV